MQGMWQVGNKGNVDPDTPLLLTVAIPPGQDAVVGKLLIVSRQYRLDTPTGIHTYGDPPENIRLVVNGIDVTDMHGGPYSGRTEVDVATLMLLPGAVNEIKLVSPSRGRIEAELFIQTRPVSHDS